MKDTAWQLPLISTHDTQQFILRLPTVNHQRKPCLHAPLHGLLEGGKLLPFVFARPIEVQPHLTDGNDRLARHCRSIRLLTERKEDAPVHGSQHFTPVVTHLFGLQADHGPAGVRELTADSQDGVNRLQVDGRQEDLSYPRLMGTADHLREIGLEIFRV